MKELKGGGYPEQTSVSGWMFQTHVFFSAGKNHSAQMIISSCWVTWINRKKKHVHEASKWQERSNEYFHWHQLVLLSSEWELWKSRRDFAWSIVKSWTSTWRSLSRGRIWSVWIPRHFLKRNDEHTLLWALPPAVCIHSCAPFKGIRQITPPPDGDSLHKYTLWS